MSKIRYIYDLKNINQLEKNKIMELGHRLSISPLTPTIDKYINSDEPEYYMEDESWVLATQILSIKSIIAKKPEEASKLSEKLIPDYTYEGEFEYAYEILESIQDQWEHFPTEAEVIAYIKEIEKLTEDN